jgi:hypothetical protein
MAGRNVKQRYRRRGRFEIRYCCAASLGFAAGSIQTLETGCEIDFHFVDAATAEIGLNDNVYTLKKQ